jgi:hypothetical protein
VPEKRTVKFKVGRLMKQRLAGTAGAIVGSEGADGDDDDGDDEAESNGL